MLFGERIPSITELSESLRLIPIEPMAATTAAAGYIIKLGDLLGFTPPTLSDLSLDFD